MIKSLEKFIVLTQTNPRLVAFGYPREKDKTKLYLTRALCEEISKALSQSGEIYYLAIDKLIELKDDSQS